MKKNLQDRIFYFLKSGIENLQNLPKKSPQKFDTSYFKNMVQYFWLKDGWNIWYTKSKTKSHQIFDRKKNLDIIDIKKFYFL